MSQENRELNINDNYKLTTEDAKKIIDALKEKVNDSNLVFPSLGKKIDLMF